MSFLKANGNEVPLVLNLPSLKFSDRNPNGLANGQETPLFNLPDEEFLLFFRKFYFHAPISMTSSLDHDARIVHEKARFSIANGVS